MKEILEILDKYCKKTSPGLLLLSLPTGSGKTHTVTDFTYSNYKDFAEQKRKIIFITNLKKNLPIKDLKEYFIADGYENEFDKNVLFINSNYETVINNLLEIENEIPDQFKNKAFFNLKHNIEIVKITQLPKSVKSKIEAEIRERNEPEFRDFIIKYLEKNFSTKKDRLLAIKNKQEYQWMGKLYPAVFTDERTVIFLSIDKFVAKNTTLIEPSYYCYQRLVNKSLIFIDEFDATKEAVLNNIISSGLRHKVDLLDLFLDIHNHLMQNECPEGLLKSSQWFSQKVSEKKWLSLEEQIKSFREKANQIFNKYKLQNTCKSHKDFLTTKRNFLFYDYQFHNVLARNKRIELVEDTHNRTNWIQAFDASKEKAGVDIHSLLRDIAGFLTYFQIGISFLVQNYLRLKEEDESVKEVFPLESAVKTVLNSFHIDNKDIEFLASNIIEGDLPYGTDPDKRTLQNQGFYDAGFCYYDIVDSDEHDTLSKVYIYNFSRTPESFLAGVCSKAMVVGISATAGLHTNIGNYDIEYLKSRLGSSFIRLKDDDVARLKKSYFQSTKGYDDIAIKTSFIEAESYKDAIQQLESLLNDKAAANRLWNTLQHSINEDKQHIEFLFCRYVKLLTAWKYFLDHPDCHAFLCFFNKIPKIKDNEFDLEIIYEYAELIALGSTFNLVNDVSEIITVLSGENFDDRKAHLINDLKNDKRRFIISSYQTIGVGQNLQFPIPGSVKAKPVNDYSVNHCMDINGIYLDNPTNLLVNISHNISDEDFIKYLFQLEFLVENGAISPSTFKVKLDEAFKRYLGNINKTNQYTLSLYNTNAYSRYLNKIIIQAIGRICRTNMKAPNIHILADASIRKHLSNFSLPSDVILVREYTVLLESVKHLTNDTEELIEIQNRASNRSNHTSSHIRRQLSTPWTPQSVKAWQALRQQVLVQPTVKKEVECNPDWGSIYLKLPKPSNSYNYVETNNYRDIEVFFSNGCGKKELKQVSEISAHLPELMKVDILHKLFVNSGWATTFTDSELILTPPMFNNIYKGALGEVCGKHIFEKVLNINLLELDIDEFERFDFKTNRNIYVDFKFWNDKFVVQADEILSKIREKMLSVKADKVFIINILASSSTIFRPYISSDKKIFEVPYLCKNGRVADESIEFILKELR